MSLSMLYLVNIRLWLTQSIITLLINVCTVRKNIVSRYTYQYDEMLWKSEASQFTNVGFVMR